MGLSVSDRVGQSRKIDAEEPHRRRKTHLGGLTEERSREIAAAARARILAEHTYAHRARQVNQLLDDFTATREAAE